MPAQSADKIITAIRRATEPHRVAALCREWFELHLPRPSDAHSALLDAALEQMQGRPDFPEFLAAWDPIRDLRDQDWRPGPASPALAHRLAASTHKWTATYWRDAGTRDLVAMSAVVGHLRDHGDDALDLTYTKARLLLGLRDKQGARPLLRQVLRRDPTRWGTWRELASTFAEDDPDGLACVVQATRFTPKKQHPPVERLSRRLYATGHPIEARRAQQHGPLDPADAALWDQANERAVALVMGDDPWTPAVCLGRRYANHQMLVVDQDTPALFAERGQHPQLAALRFGDAVLVCGSQVEGRFKLLAARPGQGSGLGLLHEEQGVVEADADPAGSRVRLEDGVIVTTTSTAAVGSQVRGYRVRNGKRIELVPAR